MTLKSILKIDIRNKRVLLRIDINSPVVDGKILDNPRFKASCETIKYLIKKGAKVAILAHQGRKGERDFLPLKEHSKLLSKYTGGKISYVDDLFGEKAIESIKNLKPKHAIMLANVRNYDDELLIKKKQNGYIQLCNKFDIFVNDAFSVSHREQGSIIIPPKFLPSYMGLSIQKEISALDKSKIGRQSTIYLLGGEKIKDYFPIFNNLKNKRNKIIASGVLANLLLVAKEFNLGYENKWLEEKGYIKLIPKLKSLCRKYKNQIILPVDFAIDDSGHRVEISLNGFPNGSKILDVGHESVRIFKKHFGKSKAIFMKGPLGFSEIDEFSYGTVEILKEISMISKNKKVFSLIGGGHLTTTISKYKIPDNFSHISLSGGALIAYISGEKLPGLEALKQK